MYEQPVFSSGFSARMISDMCKSVRVCVSGSFAISVRVMYVRTYVCMYVPHLPVLSTRFSIDLQPYITVFGHLSEYLYIVQMWFALFGLYLFIYPLFLVSGCTQACFLVVM